MVLTAMFGFFAAIGLDAPWWTFIVGALTLIPLGLLTPFFGLFLCIGMGAPWWIYLIGLICVAVDIG